MKQCRDAVVQNLNFATPTKMARFFPLQISDINRETKDCVSISLDVPKHLHDDFKYQAGQYITFRLKVNGEEIRRSYSLCSSPVADREWRVAIKKVSGGKGSVYLNEKTKIGDVLEVMSPEGNFTAPFSEGREKQYVLFAGGSGITPMLSILKTVMITEPKSKITLFYGNFDRESIIFKSQIDDLISKYPSRVEVVHVLQNTSETNSHLHHGILDTEKNNALLAEFIPIASACEYFICGPGPMMECVKESLNQANIPASSIHIEYFASPVEGKSETSETGKYKTAEVTIICDGDEIKTTLQENESILEAALRNNLDAPYACQGGSCCTCRAKLIEGQVEMKVNYALLESEVKAGFILTCQSYALTDKLVVDYDRGR
jgi:ring-1,2-phenylacetyl-CoA epoxidase subunit PaaE